METRTGLTDTDKLKSVMKNHMSRHELNKFFPGKEISYMQVHYIKHQEYKKGDVMSNFEGMTVISIEFTDGTKESFRWKDTKQREWDDSIDPSPLVVNSLLSKDEQKGITRLPIAEIGCQNPTATNK